MTKKEKNLLFRYKNLLTRIPFPVMGSASQSSSITGFMNYAVDMREFIPAMTQLLDYILLSDEPFREEYGFICPEKIIDNIEKWIKLREQSNWTQPVPKLEIEEE